MLYQHSNRHHHSDSSLTETECQPLSFCLRMNEGDQEWADRSGSGSGSRLELLASHGDDHSGSGVLLWAQREKVTTSS